MVDETGCPYVIPMNFGYGEGVIYLHSSRSGKKIELLKQKPAVCISFSTDHQLRWQNETVACSYGMRYRSVLAYGKAEFIEDIEEKRYALTKIMAQYSGRNFTFNDPAVRDVAVFKVKVDKMDGRVYGYDS